MFRIFRVAAVAALLTACGGGASNPSAVSPDDDSALPIPPGQIESAIARLDGLANAAMAQSGIPGVAVAVIHKGKTVYAKGFGVRQANSPARVDADTVFQLASISKPIGATVVAQQMGAGRVRWDTPVRQHLPWFALRNPSVGEQVSIGDLYAHRTGLPDHAGDLLEDLGYGRTQVLQHLRFAPLKPFRSGYAYTNFGIAAAAEAVAAAAGIDWATLSERVLYQPLGMHSTSSRFADFQARSNRASTHVLRDGVYVRGPVRDPDAQSAAGGVSSSVKDMAKWLAMVLANGAAEGRQVIPAAALLPAISPQVVSHPPASAEARARFYGYGFNIDTSPAGRVMLSHSGAFLLGASTAFTIIPSADVGIVVLTNATPTGVPEALAAQFTDLVQFGRIQRDWVSIYRQALAPMSDPSGSLVGVPRPASPVPAQAPAAYTGTYRNDYYGALDVIDNGERMELRLGPRPVVLPLTHWDGDVFTFSLENENAAPGTISKAVFSTDQVVLEYYDGEGLGTFAR